MMRPAGPVRDAEMRTAPMRQRTTESWQHGAVFGVLVVLALFAPRRRLPRLPDEGAVLRAVRLRLQPAGRLCRAAVLRACRVLRLRRAMSLAHAVKVWGWGPMLGILAGTAVAALPSALVFGRRRHPAAGHLFRHGHPGAGADGVLLLPAGALHRRRGRHPGASRAARCSG